MSTHVLILGESGTGKSDSMRDLDPTKTLLVQVTQKNLPFVNPGWKNWDDETKSGNIFVTDSASDIVNLMRNTKRKIIVIDDFQYILANELLRRFRETGYTKFNEIGFNGWNIITVASKLAPDVHVYIMAHTEMGDDGITRIKTSGKLLNAYVVEGLFSMVLRTAIIDEKYFFSTKNSGSDTVKSPRGMFESAYIPNDLKFVDDSITKFGW